MLKIRHLPRVPQIPHLFAAIADNHNSFEGAACGLNSKLPTKKAVLHDLFLKAVSEPSVLTFRAVAGQGRRNSAVASLFLRSSSAPKAENGRSLGGASM